MRNNKRVSAILRVLKRNRTGNRPRPLRALKKLTPETRLYQVPYPIVAITGGIGSGKSTVAALMQARGFCVLDADQLIKEIYAQASSVDFVRQIDAQLIGPDGQIHFQKLRQLAFAHPPIRAKLEQFLYQQLPAHFCQRLPSRPLPFVLYDVPLLFEKGLDAKVDAIICVSASRATQLARACSRDPQSEITTIQAIIEQQLPLAEKAKRSHWVVNNDQNTRNALSDQVEKLSQILIHHFGQ